MTVAHFLFAVICTGYMLTAIRFEERDLIQAFGDKYIKYKLMPFAKKKKVGVETSSPSGHTRT